MGFDLDLDLELGKAGKSLCCRLMQALRARPIAFFLHSSLCLFSLFFNVESCYLFRYNTTPSAGSKDYSRGQNSGQKRHHMTTTVSRFLNMCSSNASACLA